MRGEKTDVPEMKVIVPNRRFIEAKVVNPETGEVQFHIVSTWTTRIVMIVFVAGLLAYAIVLGLIIDNKTQIDKIKSEQVDEQVHEDKRNAVPSPVR